MPQLILLADDSKTVRTAAEFVVAKDTTFLLKTFHDPMSLFAEAKRVSPAAIVLDHAFDDRSGFDVARMIHTDPLCKQVPIIILKNGAQQFDQAQMTSAGVTGFINKPFDATEFLQGLHQGLGALSLNAREDAIATKIPSPPKPVFSPTTPIAPVTTPSVAIPLPPQSIAEMLAKAKAELQNLSSAKPLPIPPPAAAPIHTAHAHPLEALPREHIEQMTRKIIEEVVWEVVPDMAETLIKEELSRLLKPQPQA